jgi:hypothetical protein
VSFGGVREGSAAEWDRVIAVNFMATVHLLRAFLPGSWKPGTKHGLLGPCESVSLDLAESGAAAGVAC